MISTLIQEAPYADLSFELSGEKLPLDHGYGLYSAISTQIPKIHGQSWLSIHSINGIPDKQGSIRLTKNSRVKLRLPVNRIPQVFPLAGSSFNIKGNYIQLYTPQVLMLQPYPKLVARIVVISKYLEPEFFLRAAIAQLVHLGIKGDVSIASNSSGGLARRVIQIKGQINVGFGVEISGLNPEDSLKLQQHGLGGKHRMGCGIFVPIN